MNIELLELFQITQEVHAGFFKLMESLVIVENAVDTQEENEFATRGVLLMF